jgi:hypothetical protein
MPENSTPSTGTGEAGQAAGSTTSSVDDVLDSMWAEAVGSPAPEAKKEKAEKPAPEPEADEPDDDQPEAPEEEPDAEEADQDPDEDDDAEEPEDTAAEVDISDKEVTVKVDGETKKVKVKDLVRLAGQEAALTKKSQEVAERRKALDSTLELAELSSRRALEMAQARFKPYEGVDFLLLARDPTVDTSTLEFMRKDAQASYQELLDAQAGYRNLVDATAKERSARVAEEVAKAHAEVAKEGSTFHIKGFSKETLDKLSAFATKYNLPQDAVHNEGHPGALKLLYMAWQYDRVTKAKDKGDKVAKAQPEKVVKASPEPKSKGGLDPLTKAQRNLRNNPRSIAAQEDLIGALFSS